MKDRQMALINKTELQKILKIIRKFNEIDPQMSVLQVNAFLSAAIDDDINSIADVRDELLRYGGTKSNVSRNVSAWTNESWRRSDGSRPDGHGFLRSTPDPEDYRRKLLDLTHKGTAFCAELSRIMED